MATPLRPIAKCLLRWIYEQASEVLQQLKKMLLWLINQIDLQIIALRAWAAQYDYIAQGEQWLWDQVSWFLDELMNQIKSAPKGPAADACPEFAAYVTDPLLGLLEAFTRSLNFVHEDLNSLVSFMDELDRLIGYWDNTKQDLVATVDIIDAALYEVLMNEAENMP
jgi:hypothetical protein